MRFVLVHGGSHGRWCWTFVESELHRMGHHTLSIDLPGHGARSAEVPSLLGYRDCVLNNLQANDVLVGHSMGAFVTTLAADRMPDLGHLICLAGPVPVDGSSIFDVMSNRSPLDGNMTREEVVQRLTRGHGGLSTDGRLIEHDAEGARMVFYNDCHEITARWAASHLVGQSVDVLITPASVPDFWRSTLPRSFIQCTDDRALPASVAESSAARLGVEPMLIGSSHSPFLSKPRELAELLERAVLT